MPLVVLLGLLAAAPAPASVRPLSGRQDVSSGPVPDGSRVLYADRKGRRAVRILAAPLAGGPRSELTRARVPRSRFANWPSWEFAAGSGFALRVHTLDGPSRLWAGPGALTLVQRRANDGAAVADEPDLFAVPGGPLVLERTDRFANHLRAMVRPPGGPARRAPVPAGADLHHRAVTGSVAEARVRDEIVVFDLPSGTVRRRLALGCFAGTTILGLAVSPGGDVALTVEDGSGADFLGWAPAGAAEPEIALAGDEFGLVRTAGGKVAMEVPALHGDGARVVVLDPAGGELFHGPPAAAIRSLDFDGTYVGWSTDSCQLVSEAAPSDSTDVVPAGPCVRTEAAFTVFNDVIPHGHPPTLPIRVRCLTAPGSACRVDLRVYANRGGRIGRRVARIPVGRSRLVRIRVRAASLVIVTAGVVDPDGRRRVAVML